MRTPPPRRDAGAARGDERRIADRKVRRQARRGHSPCRTSCGRHRCRPRGAEGERRAADRRIPSSGRPRIARGVHPSVEHARGARRIETGARSGVNSFDGS